MNYASRFEIGTEHTMAKGTLKVQRYFEENEILYMVYTLNNDPTEYTNKYVNVISIVYKYQKRTGLTQARTIEEFVQLELVRPLKYGVEMELVSPINSAQLASKLEAKGIKVVSPNSTHQVVNGWKLVYDGSISAPSGYTGIELVSPPSTDLKDLEKVCEVLNEVGVKTNNSCGLHVHHDINELKRQQIIRIYEFYNKYENLINDFVSKSRVGNRFCKPVSSLIEKVRTCDTKEQLLSRIAGKGARSYYDNCRYYTLNLRSYLYYGTIEFRQGHGSTDFETISNWILFTHRIIERSLQVGNNIEAPTQEQLNSWNTKSNMLKDMSKELNIERTKLEKNLKDRLQKRRIA